MFLLFVDGGIEVAGISGNASRRGMKFHSAVSHSVIFIIIITDLELNMMEHNYFFLTCDRSLKFTILMLIYSFENLTLALHLDLLIKLTET